MTANYPVSPEGSILTPNGWVIGKVEFAGHTISAVDVRMTAAGIKPKGPFVPRGYIDLHVHGREAATGRTVKKAFAPSMEHRSPGVAAYALAKGRFAEISADLVHVDAIVILAAYRAIPRLYAITDATAAGMPDGNTSWNRSASNFSSSADQQSGSFQTSHVGRAGAHPYRPV